MFGRSEIRLDNAVGLRDRPPPLDVDSQLAVQAQSDQSHLIRVCHVEPGKWRAFLAGSCRQLRLATRPETEGHLGRRNFSQTGENLPKGPPAQREATAVARTDEPQRAAPVPPVRESTIPGAVRDGLSPAAG